MIDELRSRPPFGADCVPSRVRRVGVKAGEAAIFHGRDRAAASNTEAAIPVNALYAGVISHIALRPSYSDTHRYAIASSGVGSLSRSFLFVTRNNPLAWSAVYPSRPFNVFILQMRRPLRRPCPEPGLCLETQATAVIGDRWAASRRVLTS